MQLKILSEYVLREGLKALNEVNGCSSIGRVAVSKTVGWEFESLHPCKKKCRLGLSATADDLK